MNDFADVNKHVSGIDSQKKLKTQIKNLKDVRL